MKKAQIGVNILVALTIIFIMILFIQVLLIIPRNEQSRDSIMYLNAKSTFETFCDTLNYVSYSNDGVGVKVNLPPVLRNIEPYTITVYPDVSTFEYQGKELTCQIRAKNITFLGNPPIFEINRTNLSFYNNHGVVEIT